MRTHVHVPPDRDRLDDVERRAVVDAGAGAEGQTAALRRPELDRRELAHETGT